MTTTSQQTRSDTPALEEKAVADYLRDNPEFFQNNPSLLAGLQVPHSCGGAVSLVEHQVRVLRDQNRQLKLQLMDLVHVARDNNLLYERMHQLTLGVVRSSSLEALLDPLRVHLQGEFSADTVTIRLAGIPEARARECAVDQFSSDDPQLKHFESFYKTCRPQCGRFKREQLEYVFGDQAQAVESAALIPLGKKGQIGLLAIGSQESNRFHPGMGTLFLSHLGELLELLLVQYLDLDA